MKREKLAGDLGEEDTRLVFLVGVVIGVVSVEVVVVLHFSFGVPGRDGDGEAVATEVRQRSL